jgi:hypothetical protein
MANIKGVCTEQEYEHARQMSDEDTWADWDVFYEEVLDDESALKHNVTELAMSAVEGELLMDDDPQRHLIADSVNGLVYENGYDDEMLPENLPESVRKKFLRKLETATIEFAEKLYAESVEEINGSSVADIQTVVEEKANRVELGRVL